MMNFVGWQLRRWPRRSRARRSVPRPSSTKHICGLVGDQHFNNRGHFFAAAAESMRRILVDNARRKASGKRGGKMRRRSLFDAELPASDRADDLLAIDEALTQLAEADELAANLVKLRYFAGLTSAQAAQALGISSRTADRTWVYARSWLLRKLETG